MAHPGEAHLFFVAPSPDPGFPGDHASAAFVHFVAQRPPRSVVAAVGRVTDPVLRPIWNLVAVRFPRAGEGRSAWPRTGGAGARRPRWCSTLA